MNISERRILGKHRGKVQLGSYLTIIGIIITALVYYTQTVQWAKATDGKIASVENQAKNNKVHIQSIERMEGDKRERDGKIKNQIQDIKEDIRRLENKVDAGQVKIERKVDNVVKELRGLLLQIIRNGDK